MELGPARPTGAGATRDRSQAAPDTSRPASYGVVCQLLLGYFPAASPPGNGQTRVQMLASSWSLGGPRRRGQPAQEARSGPSGGSETATLPASTFAILASPSTHPDWQRPIAKGPSGQGGQSKARAAPRREANCPLGGGRTSLRRTGSRSRTAGGRGDYPPIENSGMPHSFSGNKRPQQAAPRATATVGSSGT